MPNSEISSLQCFAVFRQQRIVGWSVAHDGQKKRSRLASARSGSGEAKSPAADDGAIFSRSLRLRSVRLARGRAVAQ